ncbi:MAG: L,D-transpeptidase [Clostridia bacterium]|nr:L,D-transpeptidase [Clostridia bacterium]
MYYYCPYSYMMMTRATYSITVNTSAKTLSLYRDGSLFKTYPVAIGAPSTPTPKGSFRVKNKAANPGGPFGARWLGLNAPGGGYGIHGTNNPSSIGKAVSHGCVRMYNKDIIEVYNLVPVGTPVKIV